MKMAKIFLDAGHGGANPGAIGINGLREADVTLDVVLRLGRILRSRGYDVMYSRTEDVTVTLSERAAMANNWGADYFVSVHGNSNPDPEAKGTSTYYFRTGIVAEGLALDGQALIVHRHGAVHGFKEMIQRAFLRLFDQPFQEAVRDLFSLLVQLGSRLQDGKGHCLAVFVTG